MAQLIDYGDGVGDLYDGDQFVCKARYTMKVHETTIPGLPPKRSVTILLVPIPRGKSGRLTLHMDDGRCLDIDVIGQSPSPEGEPY